MCLINTFSGLGKLLEPIQLKPLGL